MAFLVNLSHNKYVIYYPYIYIYIYMHVFLRIYLKVITEREYLLRNLFNQALEAHPVTHSCSRKILWPTILRHWPQNHLLSHG